MPHRQSATSGAAASNSTRTGSISAPAPRRSSDARSGSPIPFGIAEERQVYRRQDEPFGEARPHDEATIKSCPVRRSTKRHSAGGSLNQLSLCPGGKYPGLQRRAARCFAAPIALSPDALLAQVLMASTFPLQVVSAGRWVDDPANKSLSGDALAKALEPQTWDPSVKSLVPFSSVLALVIVYGEWPYRAYPPVYLPPPPGYIFGTAPAGGIAFATGLAVVGSLWGWARPGWRTGYVNVNVNNYNSINVNRAQINSNVWQPNRPGGRPAGLPHPPNGPVGQPGQPRTLPANTSGGPNGNVPGGAANRPQSRPGAGATTPPNRPNGRQAYGPDRGQSSADRPGGGTTTGRGVARRGPRPSECRSGAERDARDSRRPMRTALQYNNGRQIAEAA
jgi:hypothetical protein